MILICRWSGGEVRIQHARPLRGSADYLFLFDLLLYRMSMCMDLVLSWCTCMLVVTQCKNPSAPLQAANSWRPPVASAFHSQRTSKARFFKKQSKGKMLSREEERTYGDKLETLVITFFHIPYTHSPELLSPHLSEVRGDFKRLVFCN